MNTKNLRTAALTVLVTLSAAAFAQDDEIIVAPPKVNQQRVSPVHQEPAAQPVALPPMYVMTWLDGYEVESGDGILSRNDLTNMYRDRLLMHLEGYNLNLLATAASPVRLLGAQFMHVPDAVLDSIKPRPGDVQLCRPTLIVTSNFTLSLDKSERSEGHSSRWGQDQRGESTVRIKISSTVKCSRLDGTVVATAHPRESSILLVTGRDVEVTDQGGIFRFMRRGGDQTRTSNYHERNETSVSGQLSQLLDEQACQGAAEISQKLLLRQG